MPGHQVMTTDSDPVLPIQSRAIFKKEEANMVVYLARI